MTKLYLSGYMSKDKEEIFCPLQSSVVLFIIKYCQTDVKLTFVEEEHSFPTANVCSYQIKDLSDLQIEFSSWPELPNSVRNVSLPSVHQREKRLVRSGLCVVLRHIIREAHDQNPSQDLVDLLGFRQGSMKMCAEVSSWTKLCEVDIPKSVTQLMANLKTVMLNQGSTAMKNHVYIPVELRTLETHFTKKCSVHNDNKRTRAEVAKLKDFFSSHPEDRIESECCSPEKIMDGLNKVKGCKGPLPSYLNALSFDDSHIFLQQTVELSHGVRKFTVNKALKAEKDLESSNMCNGHVTSTCDNEKPNCETENEECRKVFNFSELQAAIMELSFTDIDYEHGYSEGIELTIADLILITYIYHLLNCLDLAVRNFFTHLPAVLKWTRHVTSLGDINRTGQSLGWDMAKLNDVCLHLSEERIVKGHHDRIVTFVLEDKGEEDEDIELCRNTKSKHKALKPEVLQALKKFEDAGVRAVVGSHPKEETVQVNWESMPDGVHPKEGSVPLKRTERKCQQLENLATAVQTIAKQGDVIVDFCSGGGHLGILCAYLLPHCQVYLVENKEESLLKSSSRLDTLGLENVTLYQCNMDYFIGKFNVGLCLHACGSATDMVLELCTKCNASFVICPCCYGGIQNTHLLSYPRSSQFIQADISYTDFMTIGHAADQTEFDIKLEKQGRSCMNLVDTDRAEYAKEKGYEVTLCSLQPLTCSPKNNLLIGSLKQDLCQNESIS